jgi:hypothetical protein
MSKGMRPQMRALWLSVAMLAVLAVAALALPATGSAVVNIEGHTPAPLPDYDSRASPAATADSLRPRAHSARAMRRFALTIVVGAS